ncbi:uncharacterized protein EDB91DRAFT_1252575 [Suillus paluster]|uniref:uncharacterized protein n=1 Tax=Suillus paluster TaxID=48578 RepID=UPI001B885E1C|nr:uncharacterized protein EDB91DRAFT_1255124 [Suillus paluster]XP_041173171.1 uncharacterized protein EDB91DRAFT_1252575 [Suillus paluster]KAG1724717.1 hypothetical protein EDB91DRAFT_1255124 [Suillus paluster]KAG1730717.1 hypothetical protein EDB91DRAFT_1252575 [Suillus paluster]
MMYLHHSPPDTTILSDILVRSFPEVAPSFAIHLRHFVTSPLSIFEFAFNTEKRAPPPLTAAAKCLALCIKLMTPSCPTCTLCSITSLRPPKIYTSSITFPNDNITFQSDKTGLHGRSDEEKRLISITMISVVTRLALEFHGGGY